MGSPQWNYFLTGRSFSNRYCPTWTSGPSMPTARHGLAAPAIGDKIYVIGGGPELDISFANVVEVLNIGSNVVTTGTPSLP